MLKHELRRMHREFLKQASPRAVEILSRSAEKLAKQNINGRALKIGDKMPAFKLKNAVGKTVDSKRLLEDGPLVLNFYRGSWCPFCNLDLAAYQEILSDIHDMGAQLVAISPEVPDNSLSLIEKHMLEYEVVSDTGNEFARELGLVFSLSEEMKELYKDFGIDLNESNGGGSFELPVPATYVVDENGTIILSYVNTDYTERLEPQEVLKVL